MTVPVPRPAAPSWTVVSQTEGTTIDATGTPAKGVTVTFRLGDGTIGSVFIADAAYTAPAVQAAIEQRAAVLHVVGGLSSGS